MTTLEQQLLHAARRVDFLAFLVANGACPARINTSSPELAEEAKDLRQRAARARELERDLGRTDKLPLWPGVAEFFASLTGPIPSETAPAIAAAIDKTFEQDAGLLRRLADSPRPTPVQEAARMWREGETAPAASVGLVVPVCAAGCGRPVKGGDGTEALYCDEHAPGPR